MIAGGYEVTRAPLRGRPFSSGEGGKTDIAGPADGDLGVVQGTLWLSGHRAFERGASGEVSPARWAGLAMSGAFGLIPDFATIAEPRCDHIYCCFQVQFVEAAKIASISAAS